MRASHPQQGSTGHANQRSPVEGRRRDVAVGDGGLAGRRRFERVRR